MSNFIWIYSVCKFRFSYVRNIKGYISHVMRNLSLGFLTRFDINQAVQPQKMAIGLKFRIWEVEGLYNICSENKGADQLHGYHAADVHLRFLHM